MLDIVLLEGGGPITLMVEALMLKTITSVLGRARSRVPGDHRVGPGSEVRISFQLFNVFKNIVLQSTIGRYPIKLGRCWYWGSLGPCW